MDQATEGSSIYFSISSESNIGTPEQQTPKLNKDPQKKRIQYFEYFSPDIAKTSTPNDVSTSGDIKNSTNKNMLVDIARY